MPASEATSAVPARSGHRLDVWLDLLDRLAERRQQHEQQQSQKSAQPPSRAQVLLDRAVWQLIVFARWLRPRLASRAAAAQHATRTSWRRNWRMGKVRARVLRDMAYGWLLWQVRLLRTDPDRRLAAMGLAGGFAIPMALIIVLSNLMPATPQPTTSPSDDAILNAPIVSEPPLADPSVPAPTADLIDEVPEEKATTEPAPGVPAGAPTINNFRFEYFAQRDSHGTLRLLSRGAENFILQNFPIGSPAVGVMRFFGNVMLRSGSEKEEATLAAQSRCMALPVNKVFYVKTVTCTYGHDVPLPRHSRESPRSRVFWIMALSYDRSGRLLDLTVHARTTIASAR